MDMTKKVTIGKTQIFMPNGMLATVIAKNKDGSYQLQSGRDNWVCNAEYVLKNIFEFGE